MHYNNYSQSPFRYVVLIIAALASASVARAQNITNVDANQEGKSIAITYDMKEKANVSLYLSQDGGKTKSLIPQAYLTGDFGKNVSPGTNKKVLWHVLNQYPNQNFQGENLSFIVKAKPSMRFFAMLNAGYSLDSGINLGASVGQLGLIGWYVKGMTTLEKPKGSEFESDEVGYVDGILPAYSGNANKFKAYGVGGITLRLGIPVYCNVGLGYGTRVYEWETTDGRWVKNLPGSYCGLAIDAGFMAKLSSIVLSVGATLIGGNMDLNVGIGYVF